MTEPPKLRFACAKCGSENISGDATVFWDVKRQLWQIEARHDQVVCDDCHSIGPAREIREGVAPEPETVVPLDVIRRRLDIVRADVFQGMPDCELTALQNEAVHQSGPDTKTLRLALGVEWRARRKEQSK